MVSRWALWCAMAAIVALGQSACGPSPEPSCAADADCDDGNPCTDDRCTQDGCQSTANQAACSDGDSCTSGDRCQDGQCVGDPLDADGDSAVDERCGGADCDDRDPDVGPQAFEGPAGRASCTDGLDNDCDGLTDGDDPGCGPCESDADCDDGQVCNGAESCSAGVCLPGQAVDCADDDPCTDDVCLPSGDCDHQPNTGALCEDGDPCTGPDRCQQGVCEPGALADADGDGAAPVACGGQDCDDARFEVGPQRTEGPDPASCRDGLDNDCDGLVDSQEAGCDPAADAWAEVDGLAGEDLRAALLERIDDHTALGYDLAREVMYAVVDNVGGRVQGVYTGQWVTTSGIPPGDVMNAEHSWCQSWGADFSPAKSDLHHLFPTISAANSARGNLPFGWVVQADWSMGGSQRGPDADGQEVFEPRDEHKGDAARAIFYFAVRYQMSVDDSMEAALRQWNIQDPPDRKEQERCDSIEEYQHNRNPFVDRPGFIDSIPDF